MGEYLVLHDLQKSAHLWALKTTNQQKPVDSSATNCGLSCNCEDDGVQSQTLSSFPQCCAVSCVPAGTARALGGNKWGANPAPPALLPLHHGQLLPCFYNGRKGKHVGLAAVCPAGCRWPISLLYCRDQWEPGDPTPELTCSEESEGQMGLPAALFSLQEPSQR